MSTSKPPPSPSPNIITLEPDHAELYHHDQAPPIASLLFQPSSPPRPPSHVTSSPSKSPRRIHTDPQGELRVTMYKRIIICCDGTWQDGISAKQRSQYTNVLRLARSVNREDERLQPAVPQVVFYQSGIGTEKNFYAEYVEGTTGGSLADKVEEAYAFIAHNYNPGDEIFLFGFSRGAYTARMVAQFIGEIGVLDPKDMDYFAKIFLRYQKLGKTKDAAKRKSLEEKLAPWRSPDARGRKRADIDGDKFTIKFLGVWDTVGALGLPEEMPFRAAYKVFGFNDSQLGEHIERTCQALALNEKRLDFNCNKFQQTDAGRARGQYLKQVWFAGCHTDIGGGYKNHDLSDITLIWMAGELDKYLSLDLTYLQQRLQPVAQWGEQQPHDSATGIFTFASLVERALPEKPRDAITHEFIHESVRRQKTLHPKLATLIKQYPEIVAPLEHLERVIWEKWPYDPTTEDAQAYAARLKNQGPPSWILSTLSRTTSSFLKTIGRSPSQASKWSNTTAVAESRSSTTIVVEKANGDMAKVTKTTSTKAIQ